jgi:murein DD-endopeptidase MepM/ murein hydrolase activator NlpD
VGTPRHDMERRGIFLLLVVLALLPVAVLGLGPDSGVAQGQEGNVRVLGQGRAGFPSAFGGYIDVCAFTVDAHQDESGTGGSFTCEVVEEAGPLGLPFARIDVDVTGLDAPSEEEVTLEGPARVELPSGDPMLDVPASVHLHAGEPGIGTVQIHLVGVFDGERFDQIPDDGDYTLHSLDVTQGSIDIVLESPGPSPSPSVTPSESPGPSPSPSPSPTPSPSPRPSPTPPPPPPPGPPDPGSGAPPPSPPETDPPFSLRGQHSTARLMAILAQLSPDGIPRLDDILSVVGPFPVAGLAWWQNDWHAHRCCPYPHIHQGLDLFAPRGTPVVAAVDGVVSQKVNGPISGLAVEITDAGNTQYFYAHLSGFASDIAMGTQVRMGQVVGYIGNTGNAARTSPHLHFEIQPNGIPVPPMPIVDGWLGLSEARAVALVAERNGGSLPDAETIREWITKALALAGQNATNEVGDESTLRGATRPTSKLVDLQSSGPLMALAAGTFFIMILMPAVMGGLGRHRPAAR